MTVFFASTAPHWMMGSSLADAITPADVTASHHCEGSESSTGSTEDHGQGCPCCFHSVCGCLSGGGVMDLAVVIHLPVHVALRAAMRHRVALPAPPPAEPLRPPIA